MEHLKYRSCTMFVAVTDLAFLVFFGIMFLSVLVVIEISGTAHGEVSFIVILIALGICSVLQIFQVGAAVKLKNSTHPGTDYIKAARNARFWICVSIILIILGLLSLTKAQIGSVIVILFIISFRIIGLIVVYNFINELDAAAATIIPTMHVVYDPSAPVPVIHQNNFGPQPPIYPGLPHNFEVGA